MAETAGYITAYMYAVTEIYILHNVVSFNPYHYYILSADQGKAGRCVCRKGSGKRDPGYEKTYGTDRGIV